MLRLALFFVPGIVKKKAVRPHFHCFSCACCSGGCRESTRYTMSEWQRCFFCFYSIAVFLQPTDLQLCCVPGPAPRLPPAPPTRHLLHRHVVVPAAGGGAAPASGAGAWLGRPGCQSVHTNPHRRGMHHVRTCMNFLYSSSHPGKLSSAPEKGRVPRRIACSQSLASPAPIHSYGPCTVAQAVRNQESGAGFLAPFGLFGLNFSPHPGRHDGYRQSMARWEKFTGNLFEPFCS